MPDTAVELYPSGTEVTTDSAGNFAFPGLEAGTYNLQSIEMPGCRGVAADVDVQSDTSVTLDYGTSSRDGVYTCTVESQPYAPVNGATLELTETDYDGSPSRTVTLPFAFPFYDATHQVVSVGRNGYLQFGGLGDAPYPDGYIDVYYDPTLVFDAQSSVRMATTGAAPHRQVLFEWRNVVSDEYSPPFRVSFTLVLDEDGTFTTNYQGIDPDVFPGGLNAQVGMDDWVVFRFFQYTGGHGGLADNQAIVFRRVST
jgi:hypothetical protein